MNQQQQIPKYMTIGQFCKYSGLSRWHFMRIADKYRLPLTQQGVSKLVDVEQVMALLANLPRVEQQLVPDRWPGVQVERVRELLES
jgi:hypothetical protein